MANLSERSEIKQSAKSIETIPVASSNDFMSPENLLNQFEDSSVIISDKSPERKFDALDEEDIKFT